jgi:hypothetical protein
VNWESYTQCIVREAPRSDGLQTMTVLLGNVLLVHGEGLHLWVPTMSHHDSMASQDSLKPLDSHKQLPCVVIKGMP